ncbi:MAG: ABC transporter ATP-binding protein [Lentisphaerae bacterium]|nr:ABC transporter ATP-binding protein [Lentisphaerota bacterium]
MAEIEPVVRAVGLTKVFRDFWGRPKARAVNDIDFEIRPGEVVGLLGPNGSGKSTTVKMLLGLLYPTGGKLSVFGRSPRAVETKREIGYLPEESYLYKYLTAEETLDFFGSLFDLSAADRKKRIDQLLEMVGMAHARRRRVGEFSKGMARRIGLAQAMINDPSFLILDEPTSGLDPLGCREVKDLILALKKRGKTVLVTSHLLSDVEDICDRVIILYGGKIRAQGELSELLTVSDSNRIVTPSLPQEAMEQIQEIIRKNLPAGDFTVDHPRRSLEDFFLNVINTAKRDSVETAGVVSGGKIADYLEKGDETSAVLASLIEEPKAAEPEKPAAVEEKVKNDDLSGKLENLTAEAVQEKPAPEETKPAEDLSEVDAKLDDLLGNRK